MRPERTPLAALLGDLETAGVTLAEKDGKLVLKPRDRVTAKFKNGVSEFREDILELLAIHGDGLLPLFAWDEPRSLPRELPAWVSEYLEKSRPLPPGYYPTENQCSQCLKWQLAVFVWLSWSERCYLCFECLARHQARRSERQAEPQEDGSIPLAAGAATR